ncbi:hypothetical protein RD055328_08570 [Companilactobacillus sp. RD055328]|uniref:hypothetical protein n=1 Tax=Companilactobacillus sp. RD055328 TaxID=2916634 RepID=UPI001FC81180|nr:hypothetical protein [Companilactobacillus sp. RD055328]GKQ42934.1 hypothetical protein RD055328_08570 [Companilactobacillus sp. RD055328]
MCEYCEFDKKTSGKYINNSKQNGGLILGEDTVFLFKEEYGHIELTIENEKGDITSLLVNYCPMCARKLSEE